MEIKELFNSYKISSCGKVFNKDGSEKKLQTTSTGYKAVRLSSGSRIDTKAYRVHKLVAEAFIPNPNNLSDVDHIDGVRDNNHVSNLRWVTHGENIKHSYTMSNRSATGSMNANALLSEETVHAICKRFQELGNKHGVVRKVAIEFGFKPGAEEERVGNIKRRKLWKHISCLYTW